MCDIRLGVVILSFGLPLDPAPEWTFWRGEYERFRVAAGRVNGGACRRPPTCGIFTCALSSAASPWRHGRIGGARSIRRRLVAAACCGCRRRERSERQDGDCGFKAGGRGRCADPAGGQYG